MAYFSQHRIAELPAARAPSKRRHGVRAGFSLMETAMVAGIVGTMFALTLPALQIARQQSHGFYCSNNLKRIGMGVQGYFNVEKVFPPGAVALQDRQYYGFNYIAWILPHVDEEKMYDDVRRGFYDPNGGNLVLNWLLRSRMSGKTLPWLTCPASPLPSMIEVGDPWGWGMQPNPARFQQLDYSACTGSFESSHRAYWHVDPLRRKGFSGLMPQFYQQGGYSPHTSVIGGPQNGKYGVRLREVSDGLAKTMAVVETSGQLFFANGGMREGRTTSTGFVQGPCCADWQPTTHRGTTTISLPVGTTSTDLVDAVGGAYPITSGHGACGYVLFADGAVKLLTEETATYVLFALADRDDGAVLGDDVLP
jgi:hypothetical protein